MITIQDLEDAQADVKHREILLKAKLATEAHLRQAREREIQIAAAMQAAINQNQIMQALNDIKQRLNEFGKEKISFNPTKKSRSLLSLFVCRAHLFEIPSFVSEPFFSNCLQ